MTEEQKDRSLFRYARIAVDLQLIGQILGLPDGMQIVAPIAMEDPRYVEFHVKSEHLPVIVPGDKIPRILPVYQRVDVGRAELLRIEGYDGPLTRSEKV